MANVKISAFSTVSGTPPNINNMGGLAGYEGSANVQISGADLIASLETNLNLSNFTTGTLAVNKGGTGQDSYIDGELLIGNTISNTLAKATLTAGNNITITNGNGSITIDSTDQYVGTVTSVASGDTDTITITGGTSATPTVSANTGTVAASGANLATGDQIATYVTDRKVTDLTAPISSFDMNSQNITNLSDPVNSQDASTKKYVDDSVTGVNIFQGGYDAATNTPNLDNNPSSGTINLGFSYVVTVAGNFFSSAVGVGDFIIAKQDNPTLESNWTVVPSTVSLATAGNDSGASAAVRGTAGFDSSYFTVNSTGFTSLLTVSGLTSGTYNNANVTVDTKGRVTGIAAGTDSDTTYDLIGFTNSNSQSGIRLTDGTNNDDVLILGTGSITASQNSNTITLDGTNTTYTNFTNSSAGLVPSPGGGGNSFKFLNENGSWELPSYTTSLFYDTNNSPAGQNGLVPAPAANETTKFLRGDATWQTVSTGDTYALTAATSSNDALLTLDATSGSDSSIKFIAGTDIGLTVDAASTPKTITIASTATGYSLPLAADGTRGGIQIGATGLGAKEYAVQLSSEKAYVAVPWVNTTYSTFTYDSSTPASSTSGLVPAPTTSGDNAKFLRGDATWVTPTDTTDNAAGTAGQLQYTTGSGVFAATSDMVYTTDQLKVQNTLYLDGNGPAGGGSGNAGIVKLGCEAAGASHYVGLEGPTHAGSNSYIIKFPDPDPAVGKILKVNSFSNDKAVMEWADAGGTVTESFIIAASDETTDLTTGTGKATFRIPYAFTLTAVRASVTTAPVGSVITVDINESGTSILSTKITIAAGSKTSVGGTAPVISDSALADDAEITIDIDTIGSSTAGTGLKVTLIGNQ